jgi:hypothetical protein
MPVFSHKPQSYFDSSPSSVIARNLNKLTTIEATSHALKLHIGEKNISSIFYPKSEQGRLHARSANIQCLNPAVYKQFVNKTGKICGKFVELAPHPKSLDGVLHPSPEEVAKYSFTDVHTALAHTVEALQNATKEPPGFSRKDMINLVKEAVTQGNNELRTKMACMKIEIIEETRTYADNLQENQQNVLMKQLEDIKNMMDLTMKTLSTPARLSLTSAPPTSHRDEEMSNGV